MIFLTVFMYFFVASLHCYSSLAPVHTIFPDRNINAVVLGSLIRMIAAANLRGLYSLLRALSAIYLRSIFAPRLQVATMFCTLRESLSITGAGVAAGLNQVKDELLSEREEGKGHCNVNPLAWVNAWVDNAEWVAHSIANKLLTGYLSCVFGGLLESLVLGGGGGISNESFGLGWVSGFSNVNGDDKTELAFLSECVTNT